MKDYEKARAAAESRIELAMKSNNLLEQQRAHCDMGNVYLEKQLNLF